MDVLPEVSPEVLPEALPAAGVVAAYLAVSVSRSCLMARFCSRSLNCASCVTKVVPSIGFIGF